MRKSMILAIGVLLPAIAASAAGAESISLEEFLTRIQERHPFFAAESLSVEIGHKVQQGLLGTNDWYVNGNAFFSHQKLIPTSAFVSDRVDVVGFEVGTEHTFWKTGGRLAFGWSSQFTDQKTVEIVIPFPDNPLVIPTSPAEFYQHRLYASYSQPLLQNLSGTLDRLQYELSDFDIDFTEVQILENQEGFLVGVADRFLDWVLLTEQKRIAAQRAQLAEEELERTVKKRESYLVDRVDVLRAEDSARISQQNLVLVESQWKAIRAELSVLCQSEDLCEKSPEFDLYQREELPAREEARLSLKQRSRILETMRIRKEQLVYLKGGYEEQGRPQLFLNLQAALQEGNAEFGDALLIDRPDLAVSLVFQHPLGNSTAKANIDKAALEINKLDREIGNITLDLESGLVNLMILIEEMEKVLELNIEQIESARAKTEEELNLYNQGRGDLTFVILSRDNEQQAALTYAQNAASYQKLILQYRALMDEFLKIDRDDI